MESQPISVISLAMAGGSSRATEKPGKEKNGKKKKKRRKRFEAEEKGTSIEL